MKLKNFEMLINYACSGFMREEEVTDVVEELKSAKADVMRQISALPDGAERRAAFRRLSSLQYRLYKATAYYYIEVTNSEKEKKKEKRFRDVDAIANMVICYDCK